MSHTHPLRALNRHNFETLRRQPLSELSGSLGDLGTLLPILIALTLTHSISLSSTLVITGVANILTGIFFGIPLPVQPMKAIAAVAISRSFTREETAAAGLFVGGVVGLLALTGLLERFAHAVPIPVVKGIQVGAGLSLVLSAGSGLLGPLSFTAPSWADNLLWALGAFLLLLLTTTSAPSHIPYALVVFLLGLLLSAIVLYTGTGSTPLSPSTTPFNFWHPTLSAPTPRTFLTTALTAGLGQLPLTLLNSIIAVHHLSSDLLPTLPAPSVHALGVSVAATNLVGAWLGAMPACHGSGGLAAQFRFGARSGASVVLLGFAKLVLGLFVGDGMVELLRRFPRALLGVMVLAAGVELAKVGESLNTGARDLWEEAEEDRRVEGGGKRLRELSEGERRDRWAVMIVTVAVLLAFRNDAVGFVAGMLWYWGLRAPQWWNGSRGKKTEYKRLSGVRGERESLLPADRDALEGTLV